MVIRLHGTNGTLWLRDITEDWCQVVAKIDATERVLGSDVKQIIVQRLRNGLLPTNEPGRVLDFGGVSATWVLSLSEEHCSLYTGCIGADRAFFIQDANGALVGTLRLSPKDEQAWLSELSRA